MGASAVWTRTMSVTQVYRFVLHRLDNNLCLHTGDIHIAFGCGTHSALRFFSGSIANRFPHPLS
jgi:hypothetical protein